jgi:hypothetical protein
MRLERFQAKACPGLDPGWMPVRVKKTRQKDESNPRPMAARSAVTMTEM